MTTFEDHNGRLFRQAWIDGVNRHHPGQPKPGYVAPWEQTPGWERQAASDVYELVATFISTSQGATAKLSRSQKGRFVALCWTAQIYRHFDDPKPSYVADWDELPHWQQETDSDIFECIERDVQADPRAEPVREM